MWLLFQIFLVLFGFEKTNLENIQPYRHVYMVDYVYSIVKGWFRRGKWDFIVLSIWLCSSCFVIQVTAAQEADLC